MRCTIATSSVTYAMKGQQLLAGSGIASRIVKLLPRQTKKGCSYGLELQCRLTPRAAALLRDGGVPYTEIIT